MLEMLEFRCARAVDAKPIVSEKDDIQNIFDYALENFSEYEPELVHEDPPVLIFNNFLTDEEIQVFINHGRQWVHSVDAGEIGADGQFQSLKTTGRTSSTSWCVDNCYNRPIVQKCNATNCKCYTDTRRKYR
eukprot:UN34607